MLAAVSRRLFRRKLGLPRLLDLPLRSLKYLLLAFFVYAVFFQMGPAAVADFLDSPYNRVADVKMLYFFERLSPFALKVILGLVVFSVVVPYAWCRYLCPYGALLGALSLLSPLKVTRHAALVHRLQPVHEGLPLPPAGGAARPRELRRVLRLPLLRRRLPRAAGALRVETPAPWRRAVRPAAFAALVVGVFVGRRPPRAGDRPLAERDHRTRSTPGGSGRSTPRPTRTTRGACPPARSGRPPRPGSTIRATAVAATIRPGPSLRASAGRRPLGPKGGESLGAHRRRGLGRAGRRRHAAPAALRRGATSTRRGGSSGSAGAGANTAIPLRPRRARRRARRPGRRRRRGGVAAREAAGGGHRRLGGRPRPRRTARARSSSSTPGASARS